MLTYTPVEADRAPSVTKLVCPHCGEKVRSVLLTKDSRIEGLSFKCKRCGSCWAVKTTAPTKQ